MKKIEITSEWILDNIPHSHYADGNGNITICADIFHSHWINLALDTINAKYKIYDDEDDSILEMIWEFRIEDIKDDCPNLYSKLRKLSLKNGYWN